jgi:carbonic anhydrase/acetyltransferase-like protein (isoleucine patch superfamily)
MNKEPKIDPSARIAKSADVVGEVTIAEDVSIWNHATLRGDASAIIVGRRTNIQDNSVIHGTYGIPTVIGENVTVGHSVILHSCTIGDNTLIGMGSIIIDGAKIGKNCVIGAGTLITKNKVIPDNSMVFGSPAKIVREVTKEEIEGNEKSAQEYLEFAQYLPRWETAMH